MPPAATLRSDLVQLAVMAAIVTTLLCVPAGALLAWFCSGALDIPVRSFVTFGERVYPVVGLALLWLLGYVPALAYSAFVLPWAPRD